MSTSIPSEHDLGEWRRAAEKALSLPRSPHSICRVLIQAESLLALIDAAENAREAAVTEAARHRQEIRELEAEMEKLQDEMEKPREEAENPRAEAAVKVN